MQILHKYVQGPVTARVEQEVDISLVTQHDQEREWDGFTSRIKDGS